MTTNIRNDKLYRKRWHTYTILLPMKNKEKLNQQHFF